MFSRIEQLIINNDLKKIKSILDSESFNVYTRLKNGLYPIQTAIEHNQYEMTNLILQHTNQNIINGQNDTVITYILLNKNFSEKQKLKYLKLLNYYGFVFNIKINTNGTQTELLEYLINEDLKELFSWGIDLHLKRKTVSDIPLLFCAFRTEELKCFHMMMSDKRFVKINNICQDYSLQPNDGRPNHINKNINILIFYLDYYIKHTVTTQKHQSLLIPHSKVLKQYNYNFSKTDMMGNTILHHLAILFESLFYTHTVPNKLQNIFQNIEQEILDFLRYLRSDTNLDFSISNNDGNTAFDIFNSITMQDIFKQKSIAVLFK
jgi:hypothetical protein